MFEKGVVMETEKYLTALAYVTSGVSKGEGGHVQDFSRLTVTDRGRKRGKKRRERKARKRGEKAE